MLFWKSAGVEAIPPKKIYWFAIMVVMIGGLFYLYEYVLRIMPALMAPELMHEFHLNAGQLGFLSLIYFLAYTTMQVPVGLLVDRFGSRWLMMLACLCCSAGSYCFVQPQLWVAGLGRFLIGFGSAFGWVGTLKLVSLWIPRRYFSLFSGLIYALGLLGAVLGEFVLTNRILVIGWQNTVMEFAVFGIILAVLFLLMVRDFPHSKRRRHRRHVIDFGRAISALGYLLRSRMIWLVGIIGGLSVCYTIAFADLWANVFLEQSRHFTRHQAALGAALIFMGAAFGAPLHGWIAGRFKGPKLCMQINFISAAIMFLVLLYALNLSVFFVDDILFMIGFFGSASVLVFGVAKDLCPDKVSGTVIAVINMMTVGLAMLFQPLIGKLLDLGWDGRLLHDLPVYSVNDYQHALTLLPLAYLFAAILAFFLNTKWKVNVH